MFFSLDKLYTGEIVLLCLLILFPHSIWAAGEEVLDLDLSQLMEIQITSAGRKEQNLANVAAAVYVIDQESLHSSGVTSIPEALRMVPGLQVARMSSNKWAITSRGFNGIFSNKLLVQIDGRSVYTPSYSGVYWDSQNVMLEDVQRIEVIRGPGATLWGANAVNGIINIITKQASDTQGGLVSAGSGNQEKMLAALRYGGQLNKDTYGRFYLNKHDQDSYQLLADGSDANDDSELAGAGFRLDGDVGLQNNWTLQGDVYQGDGNHILFPVWSPDSPLPLTVYDSLENNGYNIMGRWQQNISKTNTWSLQAYFDATDRTEQYLAQHYKTVDIDFQHRFQLLEQHDLIWGLGYRNVRDKFINSYMLGILPDQQTSELFSGFIQDEISLFDDKVHFTLGTKIEHNDFTGMEIQPSARLLWSAKSNHKLWTSISRAVRTPSRVENSGRILVETIPVSPYPKIEIYGNSDMESEELIAYEAGYRFAQGNEFSLDMSLFYNDYKEVSDVANTDALSILFVNGLSGHSYGLELSGRWRPVPWMKAELNYSFIELSMDSSFAAAGEFTINEIVAENSSPRHQVSLRSSFDLTETVCLNVWARYIDTVKIAGQAAYYAGIVVDDYVALDVNIVWKVMENLELMLAGQNLLNSNHLEFVNEYFIPPTEVGQSLYCKVTWEF